MDTLRKFSVPEGFLSHRPQKRRVNASSRREKYYPGLKSRGYVDDNETVSSSSKSVTITASLLNVRSGPGTNYRILGQLKKGTVMAYTDDNGSWLTVDYLGQEGFIYKKYTQPQDAAVQSPDSSSGTTSQNASPKGEQAVSLARKYLGETTKDLLGKLVYLKDLSSRKNTNHGYDLNCANFVSAVLNEVGLLNQHVVGCSKLREACTSFGYQIVPHSQALPGDVWISSGHTELVDSIQGNDITLIGSNNNGDNVQEITLDDHSAQTGGDIYALR